MAFVQNLCIAVFVCIHVVTATDVSILGKVTGDNEGISGAVIALKNYPAITTSSTAEGLFELKGSIETRTVAPFTIAPEQSLRAGTGGKSIKFTIPTPAEYGDIAFYSGSGRCLHAVRLDKLNAGTHTVPFPDGAAGLYIVQVTVDGATMAGKLVAAGGDVHAAMESVSTVAPRKSLIGAGTVLDSIVVQKEGYKRACRAIETYTLDGVIVSLEKDSTATPHECAAYKVPSVSELKANAKLPDPFMYTDGTRISKKADWPCLRKHLMALLTYSHGDLPEDPGKVTATFNGGKLDITVTVGAKSSKFSVTIKAPSGTGPHPAIITLGGSTIPIPSGIGEIVYPHGTVANEKSRSGVFSELYGSNTTAGSMVMWAWGVGRIIDALEATTGHNIDPKRLGVTGCSRNGKGAMVCGAYEERIALTLPMEGGSGGISSWRIAQVENSNKSAHPDGCQTASQIVGESGWLSPQFNQFATGSMGVDKLPADAHTLAALCAPRGLFFVEGSKNSWNCNVCCWTAASAARMVYKALGCESNIGLVMTDHNHCSGYSSAESTAWNAFCKRFLLGDGNTATDYFTKDGKFDDLIDFTKWIDWEVPVLE